MASNSRRLVTVYDKAGKAWTVSHLNAHDMVANLGYTYIPGKVFTPVDNAPFTPASVTRVVEARHVQSILDGVGTDSSSLTEDEEEDFAPAVFDATQISAGPVEATELPSFEAPVEAEAEVAAEVEVLPDAEGPKRRGRPAKA